MKMPSTTVAEFAHPETSSRIALVGNRHYGSANYMSELRRRLIGYRSAGAKIHYEGVKRPSDVEVAGYTRGQMRNYRALRSILDTVEKIHKGTGLVSIRTVIDPDDWEHHDTTIDDLIRRANFRQSIALGVIGTYTHLLEWADIDGEMYADMSEKMYAEGTENEEARSSKVGKAIMDTLHPLIVDYRNTVALEAVDTALVVEPSQSLALLWGDGHVPGLSEGLEQRGYQQTSSELLDSRM